MNEQPQATTPTLEPAQSPAQSTRFHVPAMDCPDEVAELRDTLQAADGVDDLSFNLMRATMTVKHNPKIISRDDIIERVKQNTGMDAAVQEDDERPPAAQRSVPAGHVGMATLSGLGTILGLALSYAPAAPFHHTTWPSALAYTLAIVAAWRFVAPKAARAIVRLKLDMNVLMTIAVIGAVALGEWFEAATVAFLFMVSHMLETWSVSRARYAIQSLMEMSPPTARLRRQDGAEEEVSVEEIDVGNHIIVRPGEKFPLDGHILEGETSANQAPITGESAPVQKQTGDEVYAGTVNQEGAVIVEVTKPAGDTVLAGIIRLVEQAQSRRSRSEQFVDTFARYYTPAVVVGAVFLATAPPLLFNAAWGTWFYRSLVLLVIACPCALVISTPVTIVSALASAARNGVLVKGGEYLEAIGRARTLAIDKTGTLTLGRPVVQEIIPVGDMSEEKLLEVAAAIEKRSEHSIGEAIVRHAAERGIEPAACENYQAIHGKGARATVNGDTFFLGNHRLLEENNLCPEALHRRMLEHEDCHHTIVAVTSSEKPLGVILLADALRTEAAEAMAELRAGGIHRVVMLTGDNEGTAKAIADECGGIEYQAELLPADKVSVVEALGRSPGGVIMVGDGINDAPALATATVGVAMGAEGTDVALETADVALMTDDLRKLPWLLAHSRYARAVIIQNITLSLGIKAIFLALAIPGLATLWMAIAADMGASLLVIFNGLRLLHRPK